MTAMIKKTSAFERANHWIMAGGFLVLAVTGAGFLYRLEGLNSIFGSFQNMKTVHNYAGIVFSVSLVLSLFSYLGEALRFDADDFIWLLTLGGYLSKKAKLPPQGRLNAGQKSFYLFLIIAGTAISATGYIIWLVPTLREWILISHLTHNISFVLLLMAIPIHIYLGTLANPGTFRIMVYGTVPVEWARKKHAKWVRSMEAGQ